ncbi:hypothetical protein HK405_003799 [Cladochytrium tenue]|nr:hypothetical protein HK405_003799 [Cladochytrium tenue]
MHVQNTFPVDGLPPYDVASAATDESFLAFSNIDSAPATTSFGSFAAAASAMFGVRYNGPSSGSGAGRDLDLSHWPAGHSHPARYDLTVTKASARLDLAATADSLPRVLRLAAFTSTMDIIVPASARVALDATNTNWFRSKFIDHRTPAADNSDGPKVTIRGLIVSTTVNIYSPDHKFAATLPGALTAAEASCNVHFWTEFEQRFPQWMDCGETPQAAQMPQATMPGPTQPSPQNEQPTPPFGHPFWYHPGFSFRHPLLPIDSRGPNSIQYAGRARSPPPNSGLRWRISDFFQPWTSLMASTQPSSEQSDNTPNRGFIWVNETVSYIFPSSPWPIDAAPWSFTVVQSDVTIDMSREAVPTENPSGDAKGKTSDDLPPSYDSNGPSSGNLWLLVDLTCRMASIKLIVPRDAEVVIDATNTGSSIRNPDPGYPAGGRKLILLKGSITFSDLTIKRP